MLASRLASSVARPSGVVTAAALASKLASRDASISGLRPPRRHQCPDSVRPAVLPSTLPQKWTKIAAALLGPGRCSRKRAGRPALHGGRVGHAAGGRHQDSKCYATTASVVLLAVVL